MAEEWIQAAEISKEEAIISEPEEEAHLEISTDQLVIAMMTKNTDH